jgi:hypothetical protein
MGDREECSFRWRSEGNGEEGNKNKGWKIRKECRRGK